MRSDVAATATSAIERICPPPSKANIAPLYRFARFSRLRKLCRVINGSSEPRHRSASSPDIKGEIGNPRGPQIADRAATGSTDLFGGRRGRRARGERSRDSSRRSCFGKPQTLVPGRNRTLDSTSASTWRTIPPKRFHTGGHLRAGGRRGEEERE